MSMRNLSFFGTALIAAVVLSAAIRTVSGQAAGDLAPYYQAQRNGAMDLVAQCSAANADLQKRIAELEKQLAGKQ